MTSTVEKKEQLDGMGWFRWGCKCCGPEKGTTDRARAHRYMRRKVRAELKLTDIDTDNNNNEE